MNFSNSKRLYQQACQLIPGGVNSPVRAFKGVGGTPIFFEKAQGAYLWDVDGNQYIDYVGSWGPAILGHSHPKVVEAITKQLPNGLSFGAPTQLEIELVKTIQRFMPNIEMLRMVSSGTEATLSAIRLARGFTKRKKILKFEGCYHGHSDSLLVKAGSGLLTFGIATSAGVPEEFVAHTLTAPFNDLAALHSIFTKYGHELAAVIIEPIPGNMNLVLPQIEFLTTLRALCDQYQTLLIFDEVMSGFRVAKGGAQALYDIVPDLTTLAKIIGGGMPVGAFGGKREIMEHLAPLGDVYQAGTLSGNPIAMTAGITTLQLIESEPNFYLHLSELTETLMKGLSDLAQKHQLDFFAQAVGGMFGLYFLPPGDIINYESFAASNIERFKKFFHGMLAKGIYFAPSAFEAGFVSSAHTFQDIEKTLAAADLVMKDL